MSENNLSSREVRLLRRPQGMPEISDFEIVEVELAPPAAGQVLVQNVAMSVDPYMRGRMVERKSYVPPFQLGETLTGGAIGRVLASEDPSLAPGDHVISMYGWRERYVAPAAELSRVAELVAPPSAYLGVLGMPGMTAYVGLLGAAGLKDADVVFVSGAAGAVGSIAGQIARIRGSRVIGSAGGPEKVRHITEDLGFDAGIDYREGDLLGQLQRAAPDGIDVYFDNVGADHLQAALNHMRPFGRIALCGAIAQYNDTEPRPGPNNLAMAIGLGLRLQGFIVSHYESMRSDFERDMSAWVQDGSIKWRETVHVGIDEAPAAFRGLFTGENIGKMIVSLE